MEKKTKRDLFQEVTRNVIAALERGVPPWIRPWAKGEGFPTNAVTNKHYQGINILSLWSEASVKEYTTDRWLTEKQAVAAGGNVRPDELLKSVTCLKYMMVESKGDDPDNPGPKRLRPFPVAFALFNVEQCENLSEEAQLGTLQGKVASEFQPIERAEAYLSLLPIDVVHKGDDAKYDVKRDCVVLPNAKRFVSPEAYYAMRAHQSIRWTSHASRCNRVVGEDSSSQDYAFEMLVCEMGAAFLCAKWGLKGEHQHSQFIAAWLEVLNNNKRALFNAIRAAQAAVAALDKVAIPPACNEAVTAMAA